MRYKMFCKAMSLARFCGCHYKITKCGILVLCTASLCFYHSLYPPRHTLNQILTHLWVNPVPLILYPLPQLQYPIGWSFIAPKPSFEVMPKVLNRIEVWRLCWPQQRLNSMVIKPLLGLFAGVLGVIVLLKDDIFRFLVIIFKAGLKFILQNVNIQLPIHPPINFASHTRSLPHHTPPYHH